MLTRRHEEVLPAGRRHKALNSVSLRPHAEGLGEVSSGPISSHALEHLSAGNEHAEVRLGLTAVGNMESVVARAVNAQVQWYCVTQNAGLD
jgi:hypothetical protein